MVTHILICWCKIVSRNYASWYIISPYSYKKINTFLTIKTCELHIPFLSFWYFGYWLTFVFVSIFRVYKIVIGNKCSQTSLAFPPMSKQNSFSLQEPPYCLKYYPFLPLSKYQYQSDRYLCNLNFIVKT